MEEPKEYVYQGRIAISAPREAGPYKQHAISAVLIANSGQPVLSECEQWENIQCEIIIRPIKKIGVSKMNNLRLDQAAMALGKDDQWDNVNPKK